ncbi:hypothetical protein [Terriglobus tenax]|uniref:hypothetical protein n=1 Tax=Terriglobus tenax TaxID=1111115 RepID=UPI0021E06A0E|nr:hypothetical protein [Terriglobus tenax]
MKTMVLAAVMMAIPGALVAQGVSGTTRMKGEEPKPTASAQSGATMAGESSGNWTSEQLLPLTVHEAWVQSGRNEDRFFDMVKQLAEFSAQKRGLTLPETETAGQKAGDWIKKEAKKDPDQLLYVVVDRAVVKVGTKGSAVAGR